MGDRMQIDIDKILTMINEEIEEFHDGSKYELTQDQTTWYKVGQADGRADAKIALLNALYRLTNEEAT